MSGLGVAILALIQIPMTVAVGIYRLKSDIHFMDGGDVQLMRRMRAHGNFAETVPMALLAMAAAELAGAPAWLLWAGGTVLIVGRILHYATIRKYGWAPGRAIGMLLTFVTLGGFAVTALVQVAGVV